MRCKDKVAIVGMGCTQFGELWDKSHRDLVVDASYEAFEDAGIEPKDMQGASVELSPEIEARIPKVIELVMKEIGG